MRLSEKFFTKVELNFKGFIIPEGTSLEIIEVIEGWGEDTEYKLYFECGDHFETIQIMSEDELREII